jgi:hypothetical protein
MTKNEQGVSAERADLLDFLAKHRYFLRYTAQGLSDEQANTRSTVSALTVGGLIKHVTAVERQWAEFARNGGGEDTPAETEFTPELIAAWENQFRLTEGETLAGVMAEYEKVAAVTDDLVRSSTSTPATNSPPPPGNRRANSGQYAASSSTSPPKPPSTPATPTSSENPSTARKPWAETRVICDCRGASLRTVGAVGWEDVSWSMRSGRCGTATRR